MKQQGFTLIEIAIVMVIIGLLLGGILKGQELVMSARIKNIINDFNGIGSAFYSYQERYRAYPGDDAKASRWANVPKGNGNGNLDENEKTLFWQHLRESGFLTGSGTLAPNHAANGAFSVLTNIKNLSGWGICAQNLPAKIALAIDSQIDDGEPNKGVVRAYSDVNAQNEVSVYTESEAVLYTLCRKL